MAPATEAKKTVRDAHAGKHEFVQAVHGIRYQVKDVALSVAFYTTHLGFTVEHLRTDDESVVAFVRKTAKMEHGASEAQAVDSMLAMNAPVDDWEVMKAEILRSQLGDW